MTFKILVIFLLLLILHQLGLTSVELIGAGLSLSALIALPQMVKSLTGWFSSTEASWTEKAMPIIFLSVAALLFLGMVFFSPS